MNHHHSSRADKHTTPTPRTPAAEIYKAAFSTTGHHPRAGIALTRTIEQPGNDSPTCSSSATPPHPPPRTSPPSTPPPGPWKRYDGTAGDIFTQVKHPNPGRTVIAQPLTTTEPHRVDGRA